MKSIGDITRAYQPAQQSGQDSAPIVIADERNTQLQIFQPLDVTRPDVNIGKWAAILFSSPWAKDMDKPKTYTWTGTYLGKEAQCAITITPLQGHMRPTITSFKLLLGLIQIWEQSGKPSDGRIRFSARNLAKIMNWRWGGTIARRIQDHLTRLRGTTIDWERAFILDSVKERRVADMSYIDGKAYVSAEDRDSEEIYLEYHTVRLNLDMVQNMIANNTKPFKFIIFRDIRDVGAARLYSILDINLSGKDHWQRKAKALLYDDLEYEGTRYKLKRARLAKLKKLVAVLDPDGTGCELSHGIVRLHIRTTVDGTDYKLVSHCTPFQKKLRRWPAKQANHEDDIPNIVANLVDGLKQIKPCTPERSRDTLELLARWYPEEMLMRVLAILRNDYRDRIETTTTRTFMYLMHVEAHRRGLEWIKDCGPNCKHRPEHRDAA